MILQPYFRWGEGTVRCHVTTFLFYLLLIKNTTVFILKIITNSHNVRIKLIQWYIINKRCQFIKNKYLSFFLYFIFKINIRYGENYSSSLFHHALLYPPPFPKTWWVKVGFAPLVPSCLVLNVYTYVFI